MLAEQRVKDVLNSKGNKLSIRSTNRNGCVDFGGSENGRWLSFPYGNSRQQSECDHPASVLQYRRAVIWKPITKNGHIPFAVLFFKHLETQEKFRFALFLTDCKIDFYFCRSNTVVIDLNGIDICSLLRLAQFAEVPIPASPVHGAYRISFNATSQAAVSEGGFKLSAAIGRVGSIQISSPDSPLLFHDFMNYSELSRCFRLIICITRDRETLQCVQFLIPERFESQLPLSCHLQGTHVRIDHALPHMVPLTLGRRLPEAQDVQAH